MSNNIISSKECWSRIANPSPWRRWQQWLRVSGWAVKQRHLFPAEQNTCGAPELLDLVVCCGGFVKLGFLSKHRCILWLFSVPLKVNFISSGLGPTRIITGRYCPSCVGRWICCSCWTWLWKQHQPLGKQCFGPWCSSWSVCLLQMCLSVSEINKKVLTSLFSNCIEPKAVKELMLPSPKSMCAVCPVTQY